MVTTQTPFLILILVSVSQIVVEGSFKKKCLKDSTVPEYPNNVYYCNEESKSVCCVEDMQYTCCEPKDSIMMRYQAIVWGSIASVVLVALLVFLYVKSDNYECQGPLLFKYVLCCHRCREEVETLKPEIQESTYTTFDDDDVSNTSAAAAYDAIDVSRPVSQTSLFTAVTESRK